MVGVEFDGGLVAPEPRRRTDGARSERLARLLSDPKRYFAESRRWARDRARAELIDELAAAERRRSEQSTATSLLHRLRIR